MNGVPRFHRFTLTAHPEARGTLTALEFARDIPFIVERVFWIGGVPADGERGHHAHRSQHEVLIAAAGAFTVTCDDGEHRVVERLAAPGDALLLEPMVFHHLEAFTPGAVCLVLSSGPYEASEYLTSPAEFAALATR